MIKIDFNNIIVVDGDSKEVYLFDSVKEIQSHYNIPSDKVIENMNNNKMYKLCGHPLATMYNKRTGVEIMCFELSTLLRL